MKTCILLTTCVTVKTSYFNKYNTPEARLEEYVNSIKKWITFTNLDIYVIESSNYNFPEFKNEPRVKIYSFKLKISKNGPIFRNFKWGSILKRNIKIW